MPIKTQEQIADLQNLVREAILNADTDAALATLLSSIPANRPKHTQVLLLAGRKRDIYDFDVTDRMSQDQLNILRNELRHDILIFTDRLSLIDFSESAPPRPELKPGHLLYKVPPRMALRESNECIIRIAHQLSPLLKDLVMDKSVTLEEISVAEVMEVEVIDPSPPDNRCFDILLLSDGEQLVDAYSYTEWVFNIRALREGDHQLILKISVLLTVKGKERTKNIVLRRDIHVSATTDSIEVPLIRLVEADAITETLSPPPSPSPVPAPVPPPPSMEMESQGAPPSPPKSATRPTKSGGAPPITVPTPLPNTPTPPLNKAAPPSKKPNRRKWLSMATTVLLLVFGGWWVVGNMGGEKPNIPSGTTDVDIAQPEPPARTEDKTRDDTLGFNLNVIDGTIKSPRKEMFGEVSDVKIRINYGSPAVHDRKVFGELVPFNEVWRTGANEATQITFNEAVLVGRESIALPAGTYSLFTLPASKDEWTFIFNNTADQWGAFDYNAEGDAARIRGTVAPASTKAERMDFGIEGNNVLLKWDDLILSFRVTKDNR